MATRTIAHRHETFSLPQRFLIWPSSFVIPAAVGGPTVLPWLALPLGQVAVDADVPAFVAEEVADPGFQRGAQLGRVLGSIALRLAEAEVLPFRFSHYARTIAQFVDAVPAWTLDDDGRTTVAVDTTPLAAAIRRVQTSADARECRRSPVSLFFKLVP